MRRLIVIVALAACGKDEPAPAAKPVAAPVAAPDAAPPAQPRLTATRDGAPVTIRHALVVHHPDDSLSFLASTHEVSCETLRGSGGRFLDPDEVYFNASVERRLAPDGTWSYAADRFSYDTTSIDGEGLAVTVSGDPAREVELTATFAIDAGPTASGKWKRLEVAGTLVAKGCGDTIAEPDHPAIPKAPHPSTATLAIAGQTVPLLGATRRKGEIYLSTEPTTCAGISRGTRLSLYPFSSNQWALEGSWVGGQTLSTGDVTIKARPGAKGTSPDGPTVELTLSGGATFQGDYPVTVGGAIQALDCPAR